MWKLVINRRIFDDTKAIGVAVSPGNSYRHFYWKFQKQDKVFRWNCGRLMLTCYLTRGYSLKGFKLHAHVGVLKSTIFIDLLIEMLNKYNFFIQIQSSMFDSRVKIKIENNFSIDKNKNFFNVIFFRNYVIWKILNRKKGKFRLIFFFLSQRIV